MKETAKKPPFTVWAVRKGKRTIERSANMTPVLAREMGRPGMRGINSEAERGVWYFGRFQVQDGALEVRFGLQVIPMSLKT